jgi:hypothetical protein
MIAMLAGLALALASLAYVLYPLLRASPPRTHRSVQGDAAMVTCSACGARPAPDAVFCSSCGRPLGSR